ncbi:spirocyclase AveC family protein [Frankia sp. AgB1.9]|uniref:spirocyclase AveC family protein n=1 Tax=unclassified Frankia TaxID=2632575 RepID=UPI001931BCCC|nr:MULTISPECIES: spirocyclase AveC family protein [unclassified Frankia]MBL7488853.1 spirocyclase AveC family protein [Frankia sp. AgW1.1]MBL7546497.1 spirocyclase AveC family protein [Frankia sp. AgB1.9]MBL7620244.1 spirocyclase AveC family protein [Frankia sp. AgB1.8]
MTRTIAPAAATPGVVRRRPPLWLLLIFAALNVALLAVLYNARRGAVAGRITNREVVGAPRPVRFLFGKSDWIVFEETQLALTVVVVVAVMVVYWRRHPRHPVLLMLLAATGIVWLDPVMNWAPYAVYNPQLTHWPETWPLVSLAPTVEPFLVIGYLTFYAGPYFPAIWILRRLQARRPLTSFVSRHPLVTLSLMIFVIGFVYDAVLEIVCVRTGLYIYSQVIPFGSLWAGKYYQFPLLWESSLVTLVMIPAGLLVYRDDTGRTKAEKLALRLRVFARRPALGTFLVMFVILNVAYLAYGAGFAIIRDTKSATSVACPWPYPEAKVYDPNGFYAKAGQPGPYFAGNWSGWESGQSGRPDTSTPASGGRCGGADG